MISNDMISLPCPSCKERIYKPLDWFRQTYATCPVCGCGVAAAQFTPLIRDLEDAIDACTDEMIAGVRACSCDCGNSCK